MQDNQSFRKNKKNLNDYAHYSGIVFQMILIILAGTFGGIKIDSKLNWKFPVFTVVLSLLSVLIAMFLVLKDFMGKRES